MAKAKSTTITKSYDGDVSVGGDDLRSALSQLAFVLVLLGIGWLAFG